MVKRVNCNKRKKKELGYTYAMCGFKGWHYKNKTKQKSKCHGYLKVNLNLK